jgi:hypothetical protein
LHPIVIAHAGRTPTKNGRESSRPFSFSKSSTKTTTFVIVL